MYHEISTLCFIDVQFGGDPQRELTCQVQISYTYLYNDVSYSPAGWNFKGYQMKAENIKTTKHIHITESFLHLIHRM